MRMIRCGETGVRLSRLFILGSLLLALGPLVTGCQSVKEETFTGRLWDDGSLVDHFEPAANSNVKLFRRGPDADLLVQYNEESESTGKSRRRAYFLFANQPRIERREKPVFVPVERAKGMDEVPVAPDGSTEVTAETWAELSAQANSFKLVRGGAVEGPFILPVYVDKRSEAKRVLLTPATVTMDATVAGAYAGVAVWYALAHGWNP
jgi:hypothetical protein